MKQEILCCLSRLPRPSRGRVLYRFSLPQGTAGGRKAQGITKPDRTVAHGRFIAENFLPDLNLPSGALLSSPGFGNTAAFFSGKGHCSCAGRESPAGIRGDSENLAEVISGDRCKAYFCDGGYLSGDGTDGVGHGSVPGEDRLCAQHFGDPGQEDMGRSPDADQLCMCLKYTGKETAAAPPAPAGEFPCIIDEILHLCIKRLSGERRTFRSQEDTDNVFVETFRDKIICLLGEGFDIVRLTAADEKGGGMPGGFCRKSIEVASDMHEIGGRQTAAKDDPRGFETAEIGCVNIFAQGGTGLLIGQRAFF